MTGHSFVTLEEEQERAGKSLSSVVHCVSLAPWAHRNVCLRVVFLTNFIIKSRNYFLWIGEVLTIACLPRRSKTLFENTWASSCCVSLLCWVDLQFRGKTPSTYSFNLDIISTSTAWWHCVGWRRVRKFWMVPVNNKVEVLGTQNNSCCSWIVCLYTQC